MSHDDKWGRFNAAYFKACESSQPQHWMEAALAARRVFNGEELARSAILPSRDCPRCGAKEGHLCRDFNVAAQFCNHKNAAPQATDSQARVGSGDVCIASQPAVAAPDQVSELLCILNRDGGHRQSEVGVQQAAKEALEEVQRMKQVLAENNLLDAPVSHTYHPARHWDRTCPACLAEHRPVAPVSHGGDTPRTDALISSQDQRSAVYFPLRLDEMTELARQLERELAEALSHAKYESVKDAFSCHLMTRVAGSPALAPTERRDDATKEN